MSAEDGGGRRAGKLVKGISGMAPAADVERNWSKLHPEPKTQTDNTETSPFTEEDKQSFLCQLPRHQKSPFPPSPNRATGPGGGRCEHWTWMTEFDGDPCESVWEAFWRLATADVPTEILGICLAAPFAIGQVIRRLVCKAIAKLLTKKVRSMTSPHQFAVGMKQGPKLLHKIVPAHIAIQRDAHGQCRCEKRSRRSRTGSHKKRDRRLGQRHMEVVRCPLQGGARAHMQTR